MTSRLQLSACALAVAALTLAGLPLSSNAAHADAAAPEMPPNLALDARATASSVELDDSRFVATHVNDDDASTRWSSQYTDDSWIQLELADPARVTTVQLDWPNACAREFSIQTSTDGSDWETNAEFTDQNTCPRTDTIDLDLDHDVSFVRMQGAARWSSYGYSLSEFRIYDEKLPEPETPLPLVPQPVSLEQGEGTFSFDGDVSIAANGEAENAASYLAEIMRASTGFDVPVVGQGEDASITIDVSPGNAPQGHEDEGYTLDVTDSGVSIGADAPAGALNAVQTLRQLMPQWIESSDVVSTEWSIPIVSISDYPRYEHRGLMIDSARSFYTVDEVKRLIDSAAPLKINRLHLHLTDDQGWRIAIDNPAENPSGIDFTDLTEISGKTAMTYNDNGDLMGTELGHTGFYTKADYATIIDYAAENGMTVIPEVDMPGHTNAALHAIPQLNSEGSAPKPEPGEETPPHQGSGNVGESSFDANNEMTYTFITEVLRQIAEMTPGEYLHIGGDEAHVTSREDYQKMVDFATQTVADLGKTVVGWNEYASTNLPEDNAVVQFWNGGGQAVADAVEQRGAEVILSPANKTYMPQKQDSRQPVGGTWACGGPCTLENAYNWNPGNQIAGVTDDDILGVEAAFWGEFIRGVDQAQYYTFPRILATAEAGWSTEESKDLTSFIDRTGQLGGRMTLQGINFFPTASVDWNVSAAAQDVSSATAGARAAEDPAGSATVSWTVTAPNSSTDELTAEVVWDDGETQPVDLASSTVTDIEAMTINQKFTGASERAFAEPGDHVAELQVSRDEEVVATARMIVTIAGDGAPTDPSEPDNPDEPGDSDGSDGSNGSNSDETPGGDGSSASDDVSGAPSADASDSLPRTGAEPMSAILVALLLLAAGGTALAMRQRARRKS